MQVPFGEWLPDLPDHLNPGATQAKNVYPAVNSYRPFKSITQATATALSNRAQGAASFTSDTGAVSIFAGDSSKLYRILANSVVDESGGTTFNTAANGYWDFVKKNRKKHYNNFKKRLSAERLGEIGEISNIVLFMTSEATSFCAGSSFLVDGGQGRAFNSL